MILDGWHSRPAEGESRDGKAYCWGASGWVALGLASPDVSSPLHTAAEHRFSQLSTGSHHTCGINQRDQVICWGANDSGQLNRSPTGAG